jgi:hypothetical protein
MPPDDLRHSPCVLYTNAATGSALSHQAPDSGRASVNLTPAFYTNSVAMHVGSTVRAVLMRCSEAEAGRQSEKIHAAAPCPLVVILRLPPIINTVILPLWRWVAAKITPAVAPRQLAHRRPVH